jgi:hypothetical protein
MDEQSPSKPMGAMLGHKCEKGLLQTLHKNNYLRTNRIKYKPVGMNNVTTYRPLLLEVTSLQILQIGEWPQLEKVSY